MKKKNATSSSNKTYVGLDGIVRTMGPDGQMMKLGKAEEKTMTTKKTATKAAKVAKTSGKTIQQLADQTTAEGLKAVLTAAKATKKTDRGTTKKAAKKTVAKQAAKAPRLSTEDRAKRDAKLTARVLVLKAEGHSFREIEKRMAKDLGLDPSRAFGGFVAFRLFKAAPKADQTAAGKSAKAAKKTTTKKAATVQTKTAPNGAQVIA